MSVRVKHNIKGIRELLRSRPVQSEVARIAHRMATEAGEGFEHKVKSHQYTSRAFVQTDKDNPVGRERQAREHVLQRLIGSSSGTVRPAREQYTTRDGRTIWATPAQIANWTRKRR